MSTCVSVTEAAKIKGVTRQAVYLAIRLGRLKAYRHEERWRIFRKDLDKYNNNRYSRLYHSTVDGEPVFDEDKGYFSVDRAAQLIGIDTQKLYYAIRSGKMKATRKRAAWVVNVEDLFRYQAKYLKKDLAAKMA